MQTIRTKKYGVLRTLAGHLILSLAGMNAHTGGSYTGGYKPFKRDPKVEQEIIEKAKAKRVRKARILEARVASGGFAS